MESQSRRTCPHFGFVKATGVPLLGMILVLAASPAYPQDSTKPHSAAPARGAAKAKQPVPLLTPLDVYRNYLNAVKRNDLAGAKSCWCISGKDTCGALDVIAGMWVAFHRFNGAMSKVGKGGEYFVRADCTDEAIDRTLKRLDQSQVTITGDTAKLEIRWAKDDGYPNEAFDYGGSISFRKTASGWKIDANAECDIKGAEDLFAKGSWGVAFRTQTVMMNEIASGVESGKLKTAMDVVHAMEKHVGSLEGRTPLTRTVIYEEDSPTRYLRITKGNPDITARGRSGVPDRKYIDDPTRIEGDLPWIFREMYRHPKIVVETQNTKGYEVIYTPDEDSKVLEIVAKHLGMTVSEGKREIPVLQITVAKGGHHLKQVAKPDKPQWDSCVMDKTPEGAERHWVWPLHGVTLDEVALFLESQYRRPVVNMTGLTGYYWLELSDETGRRWPQKMGEIEPLDQTGLQLHWERTKTKVLVVKDK